MRLATSTEGESLIISVPPKRAIGPLLLSGKIEFSYLEFALMLVRLNS